MNAFAKAKQRQLYRETPTFQPCARCRHRRIDASRGEWDNPTNRCRRGGFVVTLAGTCRYWDSIASDRRSVAA